MSRTTKNHSKVQQSEHRDRSSIEDIPGQGKSGSIKLPLEFPEGNYEDYVRSEHSRPTAWVRLGKLEVKQQYLSPTHAMELADWIKRVCSQLEG